MFIMVSQLSCLPTVCAVQVAASSLFFCYSVKALAFFNFCPLSCLQTFLFVLAYMVNILEYSVGCTSKHEHFIL